MVVIIVLLLWLIVCPQGIRGADWTTQRIDRFPAFSTHSPALHTRGYESDGHAYLIEYVVQDNGDITVPLTNPLGQPHYGAQITVYEIVNGQRQQVGESFPGQWTEQGCFEDDPQSLVAWRLHSFEASHAP